MKKIFLFAAAAMVSLSSCVQTDEVYTGGVQEIGFKSGVTRAAIENGAIENGSISVYGAWDADGAETAKNWVSYFKPDAVTKFTDDGTNTWSGTTAQYWPNTGAMQFIAHYPHAANMAVTLDDADGITGYTVANIAADSQVDVLFSDLVEPISVPGGKEALKFHHAKALLKLVFQTTYDTSLHEVKLASAKINGVNLGGTLAVNSTAATSTAQWTSKTDAEDSSFGVPTGLMVKDTPYNATTSTMVVPGAQTNLTIKYTLNGEEITKTVDLTGEADWVMGHVYTYTLTIKATTNEILFGCTVDTWTPAASNPGADI
ncbi:MAG: fimbrillin family protein [Alistipes sp.]|nr:fimbrillin family protein [Alistipes sp.]